MRLVALFASQRSSAEFNKAWPSSDSKNINTKTWGTKEEAEEMRKNIMKAHNIKLK